jgi:glycosyltransferase involved in cell wall biosynthesis
MDRLTFGFSLGYVSNSQAAIDFLAAHGYDRRKFWLIHNGIDTKLFHRRCVEEKRTIKQEYDLPLDKPIITSVANLRHPKGHTYLIQALHELNNENFLTLLVGDGSLLDELEEKVKELGLKPHVRFMGSRDRKDIPRILAITDIFVLPSLSEGLPTAVIEAMAAACPVVATAVGGTGELIIDGETGFLISPRDPKALAEKMELLLRDYELREKMGQAGAERAKEQFSIDRMVREYEALYSKLISG